ncbi:MAG: E3 binding domain-containing protein, partial [Calditrichaeota bacterium]|nr:E3 binding domain-containing protein [Calditrichota bacterium]
MAKIDMLMPQMGESITEGTVIKWHKREGERVEKDEILLEISTDKVDSEIPSPYTGTLQEILANDGETVQVGAVIAQIETEADVAAAETTSTAPSQPAEAVAAPPAAETLATAASESSATATAPAEGTADMVMPQMGESITEGTIIKWLKNEGEHVEIDELLLEISTDKVDSEIPSPHAGTLQKILAKAGETVSVGAVIAQIVTKGQIAVGASGIQQPAIMTDPQTPPPVQPRSVAAAPAVAAATARTNGTERRFYSPLVRRIARAEGVSDQDLTGIEGTGVGGRVTKKDILNYLDKRTGVPAAASAQPAAPAYTPATQPLASNDLVEIIPMSSMRKSIAKHMIASVQT